MWTKNLTRRYVTVLESGEHPDTAVISAFVIRRVHGILRILQTSPLPYVAA